MYGCNVTPTFTYSATHTCGLPTIIKAKNTSTGSYSNNAKYWWKVNYKTIDSTFGLDSIILLLKKTGSNTIKLFVRDSSGCIDSSSATSITVSTNARQVLDQTGNPSYNPVWMNCLQYINDPDTFRIKIESSDTLKSLKIIWGDGSSYTNGTDLAPGRVVDHLYSGLGVFTYKIITTNGSCIDTVYGTVYNQRQPTAGIIGPPAGSNRGCVPHRLRIVNNSYNISDNTIFDVNWGNGDSTTLPASSFADTIYHTYRTGICNAIIKINAKNVCGSSLASWNPVDVSDKDPARWSVTNTCDPTADLVFQNISGDKYCLMPDVKEYYWDFGDGTTFGWTTSKADRRHRYAKEGNYVVTLIAKNGCGKDTFRDIVSVFFNPIAGFKYNVLRGCNPVVVNVTDTSKGRANRRLWTVTDKNGSTTSTDSIYSYTFRNAGTYSIRLTVTNPCASSSLTRTIIINDKPTASFANIASVCIPANISFSNTTTSYFNNPTYEWDFGDSTTSNAQNPPTKIYTTAGNYTVRLIVKDTCGADTFSQTFTAYSLPKAILIGDTVGCTFDSLSFTNNSTNSNTFNWSFGNNTTQTTYTTGVTKHLYTTSAWFTVQLIAGTASGCKDTTTHIVRIKPGAKALFNINKNYGCNPATFKVTDGSIYAKDYKWYANGKLISTNTFLTDSTINTDSTIVRIKLKVSSASSCQGDSIEKLYFTPKNPKAIIGNKDSGCGILKIVFNNQSTNFIKSDWILGNGTFSSNTNPTADYVSAKKRDSLYTAQLKVTNWAGCVDSLKTIIKVFPGPSSIFTPSVANGCGPLNVSFTNNSLTNNSDNFNTLSFKWRFNNGSTANTANANTTFLPNALKDSFYNVALITTSKNGCNDSTVQKIQVYPIPTVKFTADKTSGCEILNVNFTNQSNPKDTGKISMMTFNWNSGNGNNGNLQNFNASYRASKYADTIYKVMLTGYSEHSCVAKDSILITVHPNPKAIFTLNKYQGCTPLKINTNNLSQSFDNGILTHRWNFGNGYLSFIENDSTIYLNNKNKDTSFNIWLESTSIYGCKDTTTSNVVIRPKPIVNFNLSSNKACAPMKLTATDNSINAKDYYWAIGNNFYQDGISTNLSLPGLNLFDTAYIIAHAVTSPYGCLSDTAYKQVLVLGRPQAEFDFAKDSLCARENVSMVNNTLGGFKYNWNFGDNTISTAINPRKKFGINGMSGRDTSYLITLIVQSSTGCKDTAAKKVYLVNRPLEPLTLDKKLGCTNLEVNMHHTSKRFKTIFWSLGDNSPVQFTDSVKHTYINLSNITFQPTIRLHRARFNCFDTSSTSIMVYPKPTAAFKAVRFDPCDAGIYQFINQSKNQSQSEWTFNDGTTVYSQAFSMVLPSSLIKDTFYQLKLKVNNAYKCFDSIDQIIKVKPKLDIKFSKKPLESCEKGVVDFRNESSNAVRYFWKFGDGGLSNEVNPQYVFNRFGTYEIKLYGYDKDGCVDSSYGNNFFTVIERPKADFDYLPQTPKLPNAQIFTINKTKIFTTNVNNLVYEWNFGDGSFPTANRNQFEPQHLYTQSGNMEITLIVWNKQCFDIVKKPIYVEDPKPIVNFTADRYEGCAPFAVKFKNTTVNAFSYRWVFSDGKPDQLEKEPIHIFEYPGTWDVTLIATGTGGSTTLVQKMIITVNPKPIADFITTKRFLNLPNAVFFMENLTNNAIKHNWYVYDSLGNLINVSQLRDPSFKITQKGRFDIKLIEENGWGCKDTIIKSDYIETFQPGYVFTPNGFSPNKNGRNDEFIPATLGVKNRNYIFRVYNRWGEMMFETTDRSKGWDGTFKGEECQQETYIWSVSGEYENNDLFTFRGTITLLR